MNPKEMGVQTASEMEEKKKKKKKVLAAGIWTFVVVGLPVLVFGGFRCVGIFSA